MTANQLPEFENPPVTEVVCGVLFKPLPAFTIAHFGRLWERYRHDYPHTQDLPPLTHAVESLAQAGPPQQQQLLVPASAVPTPRVWFIHKKPNSIIQVQQDRFLYNWRKLQDADDYPRYATVLQNFKDRFAAFRLFLQEEDLGAVEPEQYELTYVNHIPQGVGWNQFHDIGGVLPGLCPGRYNPTSGIIESVQFLSVFRLPGGGGRLYATVRHAFRQVDNVPILLLELNARISKDVSPDRLDEHFAVAHQAIVTKFVEFTHETIQKDVWRRTR